MIVNMKNNRREFLKTAGMGSILLAAAPALSGQTRPHTFYSNDLLLNHSYELLKKWCDTLIIYQVTDKNQKGIYGGLMCPSCARIHGRCADAVYPLLYLSKSTGDKRYLKSAMLLFDWMEENVSLHNGAWMNDVNVSSWTGITVFTSISIAESLYHHGDLLDKETYERWSRRLRKAAEFIHTTFNIHTSNINYPITASYALTLLGDLFNNEDYRTHGRQLAHQGLDYISHNNKLLFGERGKGTDERSPKGCLPVDLGYNVEESLPALVLYGLHTKDTIVLKAVEESLAAHMEFMLPDGAWDNSWGTRNFKWTYWGSRTSDGCQAGYGLLSDKDPRFYKAAYQNLELLEKCTNDGLLYGGPHYYSHDVLPCIHHTFCHVKPLASILDRGLPISYETISEELRLPREIEYGVKEIKDVGTWLVSNKYWKATITGYDKEYTFKNGHPSGGALSMLWHEKLGPVLSASMNRYQMAEPTNMQRNIDPNYMPLTARLQTVDGKYMSISDLKARISYKEVNDEIEFTVHSKLVDAEQNSPEEGLVNCKLQYIFSGESLEILVQHDCQNEGEVHFVLPLVSSSNEGYQLDSETSLSIQKNNGILMIKANKKFKILPTLEGKSRVFNHVPGFEAIPLAWKEKNLSIMLMHHST